jgi:hypothetical protein
VLRASFTCRRIARACGNSVLPYSVNWMWNFWSLSPESLHQVTTLFSDRGTPDGFRHMHGSRPFFRRASATTAVRESRSSPSMESGIGTNGPSGSDI